MKLAVLLGSSRKWVTKPRGEWGGGYSCPHTRSPAAKAACSRALQQNGQLRCLKRSLERKKKLLSDRIPGVLSAWILAKPNPRVSAPYLLTISSSSNLYGFPSTQKDDRWHNCLPAEKTQHRTSEAEWIVASYANFLWLVTQSSNDCVTSQKNVCVGG